VHNNEVETQPADITVPLTARDVSPAVLAGRFAGAAR
jgi:hypothetical protein